MPVSRTLARNSPLPRSPTGSRMRGGPSAVNASGRRPFSMPSMVSTSSRPLAAAKSPRSVTSTAVGIIGRERDARHREVRLRVADVGHVELDAGWRREVGEAERRATRAQIGDE